MRLSVFDPKQKFGCAPFNDCFAGVADLGRRNNPRVTDGQKCRGYSGSTAVSELVDG